RTAGEDRRALRVAHEGADGLLLVVAQREGELEADRLVAHAPIVEGDLPARRRDRVAHDGRRPAGEHEAPVGVAVDEAELLRGRPRPASHPLAQRVLGVRERERPVEERQRPRRQVALRDADRAVDDGVHHDAPLDQAKGSMESSSSPPLARSAASRRSSAFLAAATSLALRSRTRLTPSSARKASTSERGSALRRPTSSLATRGSMAPPEPPALGFAAPLSALAEASPLPMEARSWGSASAMRARIASSIFSSGRML